MEKLRITTFVQPETKEKLEAECSIENRSLSNHVEKILIEHVTKKPKPFSPKQEYEK